MTPNKKIDPNVYIDSDGSVLTVKRADGSVQYFNSKDQYHRLDGPAVEWADGDKHWYQNGRYHRLDGPACEYAYGTKYWYQNNQRHRLDGPAVEWADGVKEWYQNNQRHRFDGPAVEYANGDKEWSVDGKEVEPLFLVSYWLERGRCCWFDETTQSLCFADP